MNKNADELPGLLDACAEKLTLYFKTYGPEYLGGVEYGDLQQRIQKAKAELSRPAARPQDGVAGSLLDAASALHGLVAVMRKHGTCAPAAIEHVADKLAALATQPPATTNLLTDQRPRCCEKAVLEWTICADCLAFNEACQPPARDGGDAALLGRAADEILCIAGEPVASNRKARAERLSAHLRALAQPQPVCERCEYNDGKAAHEASGRVDYGAEYAHDSTPSEQPAVVASAEGGEWCATGWVRGSEFKRDGDPDAMMRDGWEPVQHVPPSTPFAPPKTEKARD
jgi:hypothetical protein